MALYLYDFYYNAVMPCDKGEPRQQMCFRQKETSRSSVEEKDSGGRYEKESHAYFDTKNGCRSFCLAIILTVVCPLTAFAAETEQKAVRVGFYRCPFNIKDETGHMSGYGYDYQKDIAVYTGWKYEYVEASWPELLQMLKDGEIDLLSDVSYTPERETEMLFSSYPMGTESYYLYVSNKDTGIDETDYSTLAGKRIGINAGSVQADLFRE